MRDLEELLLAVGGGVGVKRGTCVTGLDTVGEKRGTSVTGLDAVGEKRGTSVTGLDTVGVGWGISVIDVSTGGVLLLTSICTEELLSFLRSFTDSNTLP